MKQTERDLRAALTGETGSQSFHANWLVEAGAGAGKTYIIAWRIVRQLIGGHCSPDQLVAITFTNKATNELRERVARYLRKERDRCTDDGERNRLTALYRGVGAMQISTIHGFCQTMLQELPLEAGLDLEPSVLDEEETGDYYREAFRRLRQEHEDWFAPVERYGIPGKTVEKLFRMAMGGQEQPVPFDREDSAEYQNGEKALVEAGEKLRQALHGEFDSLQPTFYGDWLRRALLVPPVQTREEALALSRRLDLLVALFSEKGVRKVASGRVKADGKTDRGTYALRGLVSEDDGVYNVWNGYLKLHKQQRDLEEKLEKERGKKRQTDEVKDNIQRLEKQVAAGKTALAAETARPEWKIVNAALNIVAYIGKKNPLAQAAAPLYYTALMEVLERCLGWVRADKAAKNLLTYDDLLLRTRNLLRDCPQARQRFHRRCRVIYVDEFQDTDPVQAQILFYLTTAEENFSPDWTRCRPEAGSLFLVGDPKQSIYRFRGADLSVYQTVRTIFLREQAADPTQFAVAELQTNFRSTGPVCDQVTRLFSTRLDGRNGQAAFLAMEATEEKKSSSGGMYAWRADGIAACALQTAAFIEKAVRDRKARFRDFLILTPTRKSASTVSGVLRGRSIPVELSGEKAYSDVEPIRRLGLWCSLLLHPGDDIACMEVLQACFGMRPAELYTLEQQTDMSLRQMLFCSAEDLKAAEKAAPPRQRALLQGVETLRKVRQMAAELAPMALLEELVWGEYGLWPGGVRQEADYGWVCQYLELLRNYACQTFQGLLQKAVRMAESGKAERQLTLEEAGDCVRVMNLHKAKGLEGRIVILACEKQVSKPPQLSRWRDCLWFSLQETLYDEEGNPWKLRAFPRQWPEAEQEELCQRAMERQRLYYVAVTRPEEALLVCQLPLNKNGTPPDSDFWGPLALPLVEEKTEAAGCAAMPLLEPQSVAGQLKESPVRLPDGQWDRKQKEAAAQLPPSQRQAITPSRLNHPAPPVRMADEDAVPAAPADPADTGEAETGGTFSPHGADWGTMVHRTLELAVQRRAWSDEDRARCARQAVEETLPPAVPLTAQQRRQLFDRQAPDGYEELAETLCAAVTKASGFLASPDCGLRRCLEQGSAWTELPFFLQTADGQDPLCRHIAAYTKGNAGSAMDVQGIIDLAVETPKGWLVVDYKTDRLRPGESEEAYTRRLCTEYTPQIQSYVLVLQRLGLGEVLGAWLCSIPLGGKLLPLPLPGREAE